MTPAGREVSIEREIFPELQASGRLRAHVSSAYWRDIGTPRRHLAASPAGPPRRAAPGPRGARRRRAHVSGASWRDIGTPRSYLAASHDVLSGAVGTDREGFEYVDVDPSVQVGKNVKLLPPLSVAGGCELDSLATIGGRSSLDRASGL